MAADHILAIDQGTTSTRAILFDADARPVASAQRELVQHYPGPGWVEHDPEEIWQSCLEVSREALAGSREAAGRVAGLGITNQRETVVVWDRHSGLPVHRAIVWQDRRTADACERLKEQGVEPLVRERTGLLLDPYFSATKIAWIVDSVAGARAAAERGDLIAGTIDCFLLWRLTGGAVHATDVTNAARTLLLDIRTGEWDDELCRLFGVPRAMLPKVCDNSQIFGVTAPGLFDRQLPIAGMAGDQQAALFGQGCFGPGMIKATYGTGCFMLANSGEQLIVSPNRLLATPAYRLAGKTTYAIEGSIFVAGAAVQWLRDRLGIVSSAAETEAMAAQVAADHGVYLVPAFVGLGAPHWNPSARGTIFGLSFESDAATIVRAALEAVAFQSRDLLQAMTADGCARPAVLRVDGGMTANGWLCQFLADICDLPVQRPSYLETTALGAAFHAGLATGLWSGLDQLSALARDERRFVPEMSDAVRSTLVAGWTDALSRTLSDRAPA